ncbi:hypothetical protein EDI_177290 [Entamoeba dispar SAW760]|uniref:C2 NT-type domain-containing protein n=1 Tax=Entamoeba dispar (strain ATCC PRA-260 / SAW760) TaxID=370354 RepID=B0EPE9_ENTDS|nr:uncharacterized protein EDI_177290 [Entamoeba dispar SAW760]EDR23597.1 hypothetical protein EDI_177290 [Entamoeba dispar SAW760]|eukprot:EDR23597.1 hypothetical protein EDI_177290 [Entamoeba dispar SAW760]
MLKSLTHTQQKLNITFTIVEIETGPKSDLSKPMIVKLTRSELERQTSFKPNEPLNYRINFIGTFYISKDNVKEKHLTLTLQIRGDTKTQSPTIINLSEFVHLKGVEQSFTRRVLFNGAMYTVKCQIIISDIGINYPINSEVPNVTPRVPTHLPPQKPLQQPQVSVNITPQKTKKEIRLTHSTSSLSTLPQHYSNEPIISPRSTRREIRATNSSATLNVLRSPEIRNGEGRIPRPTQRSVGVSNQRTKLTVSSSISSSGQDSIPSSQNPSPRLEDSEITNEMNQLFKDIESFETIQMIEENNKTLPMPLLMEIIWNCVMSNNLLNNQITIIYEIIRVLHEKLNDDFIQMKSLAYLNSTLSWICIYLTKSLRNERNEKVNQLYEYCKINLIESSNVLYESIKKMINQITNIWLQQQDNSQTFLDGIDKILTQCNSVHYPKNYYEILTQDIVKIINTKTIHCIIYSKYTTEETGMYSQILVQLTTDLLERKNIHTELTLLKELAAVLVIQNKDILAGDASIEICPHLTSVTLIQVLNTLKEKNPQCISTSTLTLIQRERNGIQYYDDTLKLTKKEKINDCINQSIPDTTSLLQIEELCKLFKERNYFKLNGLFD